jgi:predicted metal-dependent peptidase
MLHGVRRGQRNAGAWNTAADAVINDVLVDARIGDFIEGGVEHPGARQFKAEDLYQEPPDGSGKVPSNDGSGGGQGNPPPNGPGGIGSDIMDGDMTDGEIAEMEATVRVDVAQAEQAAKMQGKMPAALQRLVDSIIQVPTPWYSILERFMVSYRKDEYSWSRPNRRFIAQGIYLPGQNYVPEMGPVVIGVDTSGSIGQKELEHFSGHINTIIEQCRPEKIYVVYCDTRVAHVDEFDADSPITLVAHGGGGTNMPAIFDWVKEEGLDPEVTVVLTDGYTPFGVEPPFDVVWLCTSDVVAPYGATVPYAIN